MNVVQLRERPAMSRSEDERLARLMLTVIQARAVEDANCCRKALSDAPTALQRVALVRMRSAVIGRL